MLSILLPIYNFDCRDLIQELHQQAIQANISFEIICLDDASDKEFAALNESFAQNISNVQYERLLKNVGRSRIRNLLAQKARYEYLLFMDCDSKVVRSDYIQQYIQHLQPNLLLYGGRTYSEQKPENRDWMLHWTFGRNREQIEASIRQQHSHHSFMTNNFVIPKAIFEIIQFDESLTQYGHEDTLFGLALEQKNIPIVHLNNPLEHIGIENTAIFLDKTEDALENLAKLYLAGKPIETKLLKTYQNLHKLRSGRFWLFVFPLLKKLLKRQLFTSNPSLFYFDLYKLGVFSEKMRYLKKQ